MANRREFIQNAAILGAGLASFGVTPASAAPTQVPESFHKQPWFYKTSFDLRKDLEATNTAGKEMVLLWEQVGCVYCRLMHTRVFSRPDIVDLITENFQVIQMDMRGGREFIGLDGRKATEAEIATAYRVNATPTTLFFDSDGDITFRAPGYLPPPAFKGLYQYVIAKAYEDQGFFAWIKTQTLN